MNSSKKVKIKELFIKFVNLLDDLSLDKELFMIISFNTIRTLEI